MMLRFTLYCPQDLTPGDFMVDAFAVTAVLETEIEGGKVAVLHVYGTGVYTIIDPQRNAAERIATARGQWEDMPRC